MRQLYSLNKDFLRYLKQEADRHHIDPDAYNAFKSHWTFMYLELNRIKNKPWLTLDTACIAHASDLLDSTDLGLHQDSDQDCDQKSIGSDKSS